MKLANMSEEKIYEKYEFTNNCDSEKTDRKALYKILVDIEKIDPTFHIIIIIWDISNKEVDICPQTKL